MKRNLIAVGATLIIALLVSIICTERIDAVYEGIKVKLYGSEKGGQDVSLVTARIWYNPIWESIYESLTYVKPVNYQDFNVNAKDGSVFSVCPTRSERALTGSSPKTFTKYKRPVDEILNMTLVNH